jgi:S-formylglutathione hydrolase FrmB
MGGYGALSYAARHPGTFAAAASFSGALEVGSADAWGQRSANEARWRAHLPISIAERLRSLALLELRTGDGRPGPLDRRGTKPGCGACALERYLRASNVRLHARLRALGIRHVTGPARTTGPTGAATCARRCPTSCASSPAPDGDGRAAYAPRARRSAS